MSNVAEIQNSIASLNAMVASLYTEVSRLSKPSHQVMKTSIPLLPAQHSYAIRDAMPSYQKGRRPYRELHQSSEPSSSGQRMMMERHSESASSEPKIARTPIPLSTLLKTDEEVTFFVYVGKDVQGQPIRTTAVSTFDGTQMKVTQCDLVPSLIGTQTQKPGEILYKFIDELKNGGHIKRTFSVAPWKLCFVKRDGAEITLDQLRNNLSQ